MKFSIITPTYKRKDLLIHAVNSALNQTYKDWEMIIVNDSPEDTSYQSFTSSLNDSRIHYHMNDKNRGVNYTRNKAMDLISSDSKWIIFLDDDDYFAPDALQTFHDLILLHNEKKWFITNRAHVNGKPVTNFPKDETLYSYAWEYLLLKRCKGDATHCIETKLILQNKIRFSKYVKQGEEWFFFYQVGIHEKIYYYSHNSTITDGYNQSTGLNFRKRTKEERFSTLNKLLNESIQQKILCNPSMLFYITIRYILIIFK